jgi:uncharacterized protein
MCEKTSKIGVIGGGISGITAAWLLSRRHSVTIIEKEPLIGGHAHTHLIDQGPDSGTGVDMGFIVLNDKNYPTLTKLFEQWGVDIQDSDMSFGFEDKDTGFYYSSDLPRGIFARRRNMVSPYFWKMITDILRFNRIAVRELKNGLASMTLGEFLEKHKFSRWYIDYHIVPVSASVWSTPDKNILDFPAEPILRFYYNHGLLKFRARPQWKTVVGGSINYIKNFEKLFNGNIKTNSPAVKVKRESSGIQVTLENQQQLDFDCVVLATHADISLGLLDNPTQQEKTLLSKWSYNDNEVTLHSDAKIMPPCRQVWASWNYYRTQCHGESPSIKMSYYMNRLSRLKTANDYFVTLNSGASIERPKVLESVVFAHPCYNQDSMSTHSELDSINGKDRIYYCGAYCGYGFHEDGALSGLKVARKFGIDI